MNLRKLELAESRFMQKYPGGFMHPEMEAIGKKHKMDAMIEFAQENFNKSSFKNPRTVTQNLVKMVTRSSMVSVFEKPKFRDFVQSLSQKEIDELSDGLRQFLHGDQKKGFEQMLAILEKGKLAKWSLMTVVPNYYSPDDEVFLKPTTVKGVIDQFELTGLTYKPKPSWEFYQKYREEILRMKKHVHPSLTPSNAAFCGFLMMSSDSLSV